MINIEINVTIFSDFKFKISLYLFGYQSLPCLFGKHLGITSNWTNL